MKYSLLVTSLLALNVSAAVLTPGGTQPRAQITRTHQTVPNAVLANSPNGLVTIPADVNVTERKVYEPIDGVTYQDAQVQITPHYIQTATAPLALVTHATINLNELGWNLPLVKLLERQLPNLQSLTLVGGTLPKKAYLPVIRKLVSRVTSLTFEYAASNRYERTHALDCLADLVRHAPNLQRFAINAHLVFGNGSIASVRDVNSALEGCKYLRTFRLIPSPVNVVGRMYENSQRLSSLLSRLDQLENIDLSGNSIGLGTDGRPSLRDVISTIVRLPNLRGLNLADNNIGTEPDGQAKVSMVMDLLAQIKTLTLLNLSDNAIEYGPNADAKIQLVRDIFSASKGLIMKVGDTPGDRGFLIFTKK